MTVDGRSRLRSRWSRPSSTSRHNGDRPAAGLTNRTASDPTQLCPALADAPTTASARISSTTRSSSWYGSPTATTSVIAPSRAPASSAARGHRPGGGRGRSHRQRGAGRPATAAGGDHREFRFVPLEDQPDTADLGVTQVDAWQGRGLGSALPARLSERAVEVGVGYFTAEVLAKTGPCSLSWPPWAGSRPNRPARGGHHPRRDRRSVPDRTSGDVRHTRVPDSGAELGKRVWLAGRAVLLREAVSWVFTRRAWSARSR